MDEVMNSEPLIPSALRCEYAVDPIGLDTPRPRFSWIIAAERRGASQSDYQLVVGLSRTDVEGGVGPVWDSGPVESARSASVEFDGEALKSRTEYFWAVRVRDENDVWGPYSVPASFETAFLSADEWRASWIATGDNRRHAVSPMLRKEFVLAKPIVRARAYVTGLGYYELRINGNKVGDSVLDPGWTDTGERVLYATYDVTDLLTEGQNAVGAQLGVGRFSTPPRSEARSEGGSRSQLLLQLHVDHPDGDETIIISDGRSGWLATADTPIVDNSIYNGETYDARLEMPGWDEPGFAPGLASSWRRAVVVEAPRGKLVAQALEPIKVVEEIEPVAAVHPAPGVFVYDLGQNFAGWARIRLSGLAGDRISLKYAEMVFPDGTVNQENLRSARATDVYVLRGGPAETYEPRFTYHGFRYVQVECLAGTPDIASLVGCVVRSSVRMTGRFASSSEYLNQLHRAIVWTEASNLHSLPTDCPQRDERLGWLNDMTVRCEEAVFNFDLARLYAKWIDDISDAQGATTGAISDTAPFIMTGGRPADPVSTSFLLVPWLTYLHYGDERTLREHYADFVKWFRYLQGLEQDGLLEFTRYGDWAPPMTESAGVGTIGAGAIAAHTPGGLISSGYHFYNAQLLARFAGIIGNDDDRREFEALAERTKSAIQERYFDYATSNYGTGNQACNAFALYLDLVPAEHKKAVLESLVRNIEEHDFHVTTGNLTTKYLIDVLTENGRGDIAYALVTQRTYPSWGYMLDNGATTIWERWEHVTSGELAHMGSHNHPMYGAVGSWFYRYLGGVDVDEASADAAGFSVIRVKPHLVDGVSEVACSLDTVKGEVAVHWTRSDTEIILDVTVPANSRAIVYVPKAAGGTDASIFDGSVLLWSRSESRDSVAGISNPSDAGDYVRLTALSGNYRFVSTAGTGNDR
jgi:alpha-L-rhamnosidase